MNKNTYAFNQYPGDIGLSIKDGDGMQTATI